MRGKRFKNRRGFTLIELIMAIVIAPIVVGAMGILLISSQRGWNRMYTQVHGDLVTDGYFARRVFDSVVRKSSTQDYHLSDGQLEVYYYSNPYSSATLDRYSRFYVTARNELRVDYGELDTDGNPATISHTTTLARNVDSVDFSTAGSSLQMTLRLDDGTDSVTVVTSSIRHND